MNKKIISLVLALVMVLGTFTSVFAEAAKEPAAKKDEVKKTETKKAEAGEKVEKVVGKDNKIQYVIDKKLVEGYEDGTYGLDKNIKRSEITRLLVLANGNEELSKQLQGSMKIYSDVDAKHWANGVITVGTTVPSDANGIAMLAGYPDGSFKPENDVTYAELAKMLVVLAKKDLTADMVKNAKWASDWMTWAAQLGILNDVNVTDSNKAANRADAFTMIYNALYTMKEFKRVPANETRGIISNFTKDILTLNQDSKMEYKVTGDTVFVTGTNASRQQIVKLNTLNLKATDYYLGSLVRILVNEKNEVTHIIELGNPADLAKGMDYATAGHNTVWRGVADNTVETRKFDPKAFKMASNDNQVIANTDAYATIGFKNANKIDANTITFHNVNERRVDNKVVRDDITLKINDKTEFYVANPGNNIMKKVANVNEALALLGYKNYDNYRIVDVYAGFDTDGIKSNYGAIKFDTKDRHTAKVVVFNLVNKSFEGEKFRVINDSSSKFMTTLENTDGKLFDKNNVNDTSRFPLEYGDKLDVIEMDSVRTGSIYKTVIDHSEYKNYPVVEIVDVDGKVITVRDIDGVTSYLDTRDADVFSAKRYDGLVVGNFIQFRVENKDSNTATDISLLGKNYKDNDGKTLRGSLVGVLPVVHKGTAKGVVTEVGTVGDYVTFTVREDNSLANADRQYHYSHYVAYNQNLQGLAAMRDLKRPISFIVTDQKVGDRYLATEIKDNATQLSLVDYLTVKPAKLEEAKADLTAKIQAAVTAEGATKSVNPTNEYTVANFGTEALASAQKTAIENFAKAVEEVKKAEAAVNELEKVLGKELTKYETGRTTAKEFSERVWAKTSAFNKLVKDQNWNNLEIK